VLLPEIADEGEKEILPLLSLPDQIVTPLRVTFVRVKVLGFGPLPPIGSQVAETVVSEIATPLGFVI
jgi:hypothetical protein